MEARPSTRGLALLAGIVLLAFPQALAQKDDVSLFAPLNDDFAAGETLRLLLPRSDAREQPTFGATYEPGEPEACGGEATVWYALRPLAGGVGMLRVDTFGSDYDTVVAVYRGTDLGALRLVACNDDAGPGALHSSLTFPAVPGETYHVQVSGVEGATGHLRLSVRDALPALL